MRGRASAGMALVFLAVALLATPVALAAPPANNSFASATPLDPEYDFRDGEPTAEATMEMGEPTMVDGAAVSHSVWYSWTSPYAGSARVLACKDGGSAIDPTVAVYTGSAVNALTKVGSSQASGSTCREVVVNVAAGTTYHAAAYGINNTSGDLFFTLDQDVAAAAPANDSFAGAIPLSGSPTAAAGTNRGATAEAGEPEHDPGPFAFPALGTVWYAWTPSVTGLATVDLCASSFDTYLDVFIGAAVGQLSRIVGDENSCPSGTFDEAAVASFYPACGTTFYISVDGDLQSFFPARGDINLQITQEPGGIICPAAGGGGPGPGPGGGGSGDSTAPDTEITKRPKKKTIKRRARVTFASTEAGSSFTCSLDGKAFGCTSPFTRKVRRGRHRFSVFATDAAGNRDATAAAFRWTVRRAKKARRAR